MKIFFPILAFYLMCSSDVHGFIRLCCAVVVFIVGLVVYSSIQVRKPI